MTLCARRQADLHSEAEVAKEKPQNQTESVTGGWTGGGGMESFSEEGRTCQGQHLTDNKVHLLTK
jgi:hypothetical protein